MNEPWKSPQNKDIGSERHTARDFHRCGVVTSDNNVRLSTPWREVISLAAIARSVSLFNSIATF
jgi:hypothetical protein